MLLEILVSSEETVESTKFERSERFGCRHENERESKLKASSSKIIPIEFLIQLPIEIRLCDFSRHTAALYGHKGKRVCNEHCDHEHTAFYHRHNSAANVRTAGTNEAACTKVQKRKGKLKMLKIKLS